jgi:light-regulated signal transduction histidine kinase (bacteriophytochrome)
MGRAALKPMPVDMNVLVQEVQRRLALETKDRKIEWRVHPLPAVVADPFMLRLAVENLLSNAVKYTRPREVATIEVGARQEAGETVFFVRDNGVGFDMAYVGKLFGVFQRLHRMEEFEGTGIGLANVRRIVERHGGRAWATGALNQGATFSFSIPGPEGG